MKSTLIIVSILLVANLCLGQQPFEKYGYEVEISTLSKGKYIEDFTTDSLVQVGSVVLNRVTGKIVSFVTYDTVYSEATLDPQLISRWMSPDPLAEKYYDLSPYNYVANNPILYIDPDGRQIQISFANSKAREAFLNIVNNALEGQYQVTLNAIEGQDGVFNVGLEALKNGNFDNLTENGKAFHDNLSGIISDEGVISITGVYGKDDVTVGKYRTGEVDFADVEQFNITGPDIEKSVGATQAGKIAHEFTEQLMRVKYGVPLGSDDFYNPAHRAAIQEENRVNGNTRGKQYGTYKNVTIPYTDSEGNVVHVNTVIYDGFGKRRVIKVLQPKPKGKKRE